uniref:Large ribosomal subunit protein mL40 n=1 Tax=Panagrellus redivivus TaxID=6233 RepID=A0A7E4ZXX5_PANRE
MLKLAARFDSILTRSFQTTSVSSSIFMKRQKKVDPEVAKVREARKRKKLEREIRQMQKHSKKPKPVEELAIDVASAKNLHERLRTLPTISEEKADERAFTLKAYTKFCHEQRLADERWLRRALKAQDSALNELKRIAPELYEAAVEPDTGLLPLKMQGPSVTPPLKEYQSPDGDYVDTTRTWS